MTYKLKRLILAIFLIFFTTSSHAAGGGVLTKTVQAQFIGNLNSSSLIAQDITPMQMKCGASAQGDCYFITTDGVRYNGFALGGAEFRDVRPLKGVPNSISAKFDTTPRPVELITASGQKTTAYFSIVAIGFQINGPYTGVFNGATDFSKAIAYSNGTPWPSDTNVALVAGGDCYSDLKSTFFYVQARAFRTFWFTNKRGGMANCFATNAIWSNASNALGNYQAIGPYFLYQLTTNSVTGLEPGHYSSVQPLQYTVGTGKNIDPFTGTDMGNLASNYQPFITQVNINVSLSIEHEVKVTSGVTSLKLYPGTSMSWDKWRQLRTPLKNDAHFRLASTGPIRMSIICKDGYTAEGDCALRRRLASSTGSPGVVDPADPRLYGIKFKVNIAGFNDYYTKEAIQNKPLKPSTTAVGTTPTSSLSIVPTTTSMSPAVLDIETAAGVAELMEDGRTYAGTITVVFEPGEI